MRSRNNMPATNAPGTDETTGAHCETLRLLTAAYGTFRPVDQLELRSADGA
jgi:hypothetical protein